jgi:hypothetical protein
MTRSELVGYLRDWRENSVLDVRDAEALDEAVWYLIHDFEIYSAGRVAPTGGLENESRVLMNCRPMKKHWWQRWRA